MGLNIQCIHCDEPVTERSPETVRVWVADGFGADDRLIHRECHLRGVLGGVNHQKGACSCYGGSEPSDPPGLSRHEAAFAAVDYWKTQCRENHEQLLRFIFSRRL